MMMKNKLRNNFNKKFYSQVYDRIVKFSENLKDNEMKIPMDKDTYSIFFSKEDKLSDLTTRINGTSENIQKVEFLSFQDEKINEDLLFDNLSKSPFKVRINGHHMIKYFPCINKLISNKNFKLGDNYNNMIIDTIDKISLTENNLGVLSVINSNKKEIEEKITNLMKIYEKQIEEYSQAEIVLDKKLKDKKFWFINSALLFFIAHLIVFYVLIYQIYGWDTIEPITYIVGNVYWIFGLSYFILRKKKLDIGLLSSNGYRKEFFKNMGRRIGYSSIEKDFLMNELVEIRKFKETIAKI